MNTRFKGKRVVFRRRGVVELEEFYLDPPGKDEVLLKAITTVISPGTETAFLLGLPNTSGTYPQYPGYSFAGVVEATGENTEFEIGDRVVAACHHASLVLTNKDRVLRIPKGTSFEEAAFFNLAAIAMQGVRKAQVELGESVAVFGLGVVGLLAAQLAKLSGAIEVIGVDLYENRRRTALKVGVDHVIDPRQADPIETIRGLTNGGADIVIEATGHPNVIVDAIKAANRLGRVILLGSTRGITNGINFYRDVHRKGIVIIGAHTSVRPRHESFKYFWTVKDEWRLSLKLINRKLLKVAPLISAKMSYKEAVNAYRLLIEEKNKVLTVALNWNTEDPAG